MLGVAGARLAALPAGQVPKVGAAAVTALALHMGQAVALPAVPVTVALLRPTGAGISAQGVAGATWNQEALSRDRDEGMRTEMGTRLGWRWDGSSDGDRAGMG